MLPMSLSRNLSLGPVSESDMKPKAGPSRNGLNDRTVPPLPVQIMKACTQCRREKSRCDNERPCHTCIRKGRTEFCVTGCYRCRHERLSCDDSRPCNHCRGRGLECTDVRPSDYPIPRPRHRRRRRVPRAPKPLKPPAVQPEDSPTEPHGRDRQRDGVDCLGGPRCGCKQSQCKEVCAYGMISPRVRALRCEQCYRKHRKCDNARPCTRCKLAGDLCIDVTDSARAKGGCEGGPKSASTSTCLPCHEANIQCGKTRPCSNCVRRKMKCIDPDGGADLNNGLQGSHSPCTFPIAPIDGEAASSSTNIARDNGPTTRYLFSPTSTSTTPPPMPPPPEGPIPPGYITARSASWSILAASRFPYLPSIHSLGLLRLGQDPDMQHGRSLALPPLSPPSESWASIHEMLSYSISHLRSTAEDF